MRLTAFALTMIVSCAPAFADELAIVGTGDGVEMLQAMATKYRQIDPATEVKIPPSIGSGGGIAAIGAGTAKLARVARTLTDAERSRGLALTMLAKIPSAFFVHPSAKVANLDTQQLQAIYAGKITNWNEIGGADLRIRVVRREEADSTLVTLRALMPGWRDLQITERSKTAVSTQEAVETVRLTPGSIGFGPYSKALDVDTKVLTIDGHHPTQPGYPSNGILAFVYRPEAVTPEVKKFMDFAKAGEAAEIMRSFGAVPASD